MDWGSWGTKRWKGKKEDKGKEPGEFKRWSKVS
jgi:hypothetical protein